MSLFTIEIEGKPVLTVAQEDELAAHQFACSEPLRQDLSVLEDAGRPVWNGESELFVREAEEEERSAWEKSFARALQNGDADPADRDEYAVFLVPVQEPD